MTQEPKHTPTPWKLGEADANYQSIVKDIEHEGITLWLANVCNDSQNAAFIVRACNAHDELVAAAQNLLDIVEEHASKIVRHADRKRLTQALAKARGEA